MRAQEWSTFFGLLYCLRSKFVYFGRNTLEVADLPPHQAIDNPVVC